MDSIILEAINVTANGPECIGVLHTKTKEDLHAVFTGRTFTTKKSSIPGIVPTKMTSKEGVPAQNILTLPFSLADEAYTCGEAVIFRQYSKEFHLGIERKDSYIPFNKVKKIYDLKASRERFKVYKELDIHVMMEKNSRQVLVMPSKGHVSYEREDLPAKGIFTSLYIWYM